MADAALYCYEYCRVQVKIKKEEKREREREKFERKDSKGGKHFKCRELSTLNFFINNKESELNFK